MGFRKTRLKLRLCSDLSRAYVASEIDSRLLPACRTNTYRNIADVPILFTCAMSYAGSRSPRSDAAAVAYCRL
jgi:hypothetical protein